MAAPPQSPLSHENRILVATLLGGLPAVVIAFVLLGADGYSARAIWTLALVMLGFWLGCAFLVRERVTRPLQTMANLLSALREGDFSVRARGAKRDEPLGDLLAEINLLGAVLQEQRLGALEATALLRTVMEEIDVAIFAFDAHAALRLVNRTGQELLAQPAERILGRSAQALQLADCLTGDSTRILARNFPGATGRWGLRRTLFREGGRPHSLVMIADLSQPLREEELRAWQRLVRVIGHELNNSLAPIKSIAGSLGTLLRRPQRAPDWEDDLRGGLEIIEARAEGLNRFMQAYARLARLPPPAKVPTAVGPLLRRLAALEHRARVEVRPGAELTVPADTAQLEQVIINLLKNAAEARPEDRPEPELSPVRLGWIQTDGRLEITVEDDGPGIANPQNLFVPFFTTKPGGSGIGLVLCRQIAENHGGTLTLENRADATGCVARLSLPL